MFHKLSKAFDEGGAKGMLLYNMRVSHRSCSLSFLTTHTEPLMKKAEQIYHSSYLDKNVIDMSDLVQRSGLTIDRVNQLCIADKLTEFDAMLGKNRCTLGIKGMPGELNETMYRSVAMKPVIQQGVQPMSSIPAGSVSPGLTTTENSAEPSPAVDAGPTPVIAADYVDDYDPADDIIFPGMDDHDQMSEPMDEDSAPSPATASQISSIPPRRSSVTAHMLLSPGSMKLQWANEGSSSQAPNPELVRGILNLDIDADNEYAYIDVNQQLQQQALLTNTSILNTNNAWAGARHWRYAARSLAK
jgi:hypothetical protein